MSLKTTLAENKAKELSEKYGMEITPDQYQAIKYFSNEYANFVLDHHNSY